MTLHATASHDMSLKRLEKRLERERLARLEAEAIAERGLRELYEKQQQLQLLEAIAVAANQANKLNDILQLALSKICQFSAWQLGHAYIIDPKQPHRLKPSMIWHCSGRESVFEAFQELTHRTYFEQGIGLPGRVFASGQATWIVNIADDSNFVRQACGIATGIKTACAFPILTGHRVTAVLEFFSLLESPPQVTLLQMMAQIGIHLGRVVERQLAEERLLYDAFHDPLTGLPNRALFLDRLKRAAAHKRRYPNYQFAVLFIDLDRFKVVNDSLGHFVGDSLIHQIAKRLLTTLRNEDMLSVNSQDIYHLKDTLARLGGDEFTLLLDDLRGSSDAMRVAERIQHVLNEPFILENQTIYIAASIGIALAHADIDADDLIRNADLAMYRAKSLGGKRSEFFDQSMHTLAINRLLIENDLRLGILQQQFILHYQPIVCLASGQLVGVEALIRWQKAEKLVFPNDFIPIAEESGLIISLDLWVMAEACRTVKRWLATHPVSTMTVSINLSARLFALENLASHIQHILAETGINPQLVRLEITESMTMQDTERAIHVLKALKTMGLNLSIDDFGTGYSSLSYLHRFPADTLKIDRSFVLGLNESHESQQIVASIISLARNLNMKVIAEGTETLAHVQQLQQLQCDFAQGYYFSKPVPAQAIEHLLSSQHTYHLISPV
ncbi:EAL domain-containing protein [Agitococcus lubricus]|uniref:Diguanylate cyclase (GGDEF)-like protein n=1 Tax=Agitococcus lubricus TaxID=1077255 RepID=A0A2T5IY54_9GAMM|nr:EAL domain-containing protein [Agitococcus lubricus]PTQ88916.1 diguanylate cyclase (GGDEF)-like protein [Agitococcus lubricus]